MEANSYVIITIIVIGILLMYFIVAIKSLYIDPSFPPSEPLVKDPKDLICENYRGFKKIIALINYEKLNNSLIKLTEPMTVLFLCIIFILLLIVFILINNLESLYTFLISFLPLIFSLIIISIIYKVKQYEAIIKK